MRGVALLALSGSLLLVAPALASATAGDRAPPAEATGRLLVSLEQRGTGARAAAAPVLARAAGRRAGPAVPQIGLVTVRPARGDGLRALATRLRADRRVRAVDVERRARPRLVPADPALSETETAPGTPSGTVVQWWAEPTGLFSAWDVARGTGALVAFVDSGVMGDHPDLAGKIRSTIDADPTPGAGGPLVDETGHGTHLAALACAAAGNGVGIAGAGLDCGLIVAKTDFSDASVAAAIVEAADRGAHAINLSFGTDGGRPVPTAFDDALRYAEARGAVLVAAAADQPIDEQGDPANVLQPTGSGPDPARGRGLSVTAATRAGTRAPFAGRGTQISLAAYGAFAPDGQGPWGLMSAWPAAPTLFDRGEAGPPGLPPCGCRTSFHGDHRYAYLQGTSMATAIVSAVAALTRELNPDLSAPEVVRLLKRTARRPPGTGWTPDLGWGIVDAGAAVAAARAIDRRAPASRVTARAEGGTIALTVTSRDAAPPAVVASDIDRVEIWRASSGRPARLERLARRSVLRVAARPGARYTFHTIAVDRAGNREEPPARPDATVTIPNR